MNERQKIWKLWWLHLPFHATRSFLFTVRNKSPFFAYSDAPSFQDGNEIAENHIREKNICEKTAASSRRQWREKERETEAIMRKFFKWYWCHRWDDLWSKWNVFFPNTWLTKTLKHFNYLTWKIRSNDQIWCELFFYSHLSLLSCQMHMKYWWFQILSATSEIDVKIVSNQI